MWFLLSVCWLSIINSIIQLILFFGIAPSESNNRLTAKINKNSILYTEKGCQRTSFCSRAVCCISCSSCFLRSWHCVQGCRSSAVVSASSSSMPGKGVRLAYPWSPKFSSFSTVDIQPCLTRTSVSFTYGSVRLVSQGTEHSDSDAEY